MSTFEKDNNKKRISCLLFLTSTELKEALKGGAR